MPDMGEMDIDKGNNYDKTKEKKEKIKEDKKEENKEVKKK